MLSRKSLFVKLFIPAEVGPVSSSNLDTLLDQLHKVTTRASTMEKRVLTCTNNSRPGCAICNEASHL